MYPNYKATWENSTLHVLHTYTRFGHASFRKEQLTNMYKLWTRPYRYSWAPPALSKFISFFFCFGASCLFAETTVSVPPCLFVDGWPQSRAGPYYARSPRPTSRASVCYVSRSTSTSYLFPGFWRLVCSIHRGLLNLAEYITPDKLDNFLKEFRLRAKKKAKKKVTKPMYGTGGFPFQEFRQLLASVTGFAQDDEAIAVLCKKVESAWKSEILNTVRIMHENADRCGRRRFYQRGEIHDLPPATV